MALVGGGTGLIGDPSGKTTERQLNTREVVEANAAALRAQLARFLDFEGDRGGRDGEQPRVARTARRAVDFLRDVGKHFSVNVMLRRTA